MLRTVCVCLLVVGSILTSGRPSLADESAVTSPAWKYRPQLLRPFWRGDTVEGESVLFIKDDSSGSARASVLFPVRKIVSVQNSAGDVMYEEGRDYVWREDSREIVLPPGSRIPGRTPKELRRPANSQKYQLTHRDGDGEIFFGARLEYAEMQTCITYTHAPDAWKAPVPKFEPAALPRTYRRLTEKLPVSLVVLGDSISAGANASSLGEAPPYQPAYPELFRQELAARFATRVDLKNLAVGGTDTAWGVTQVDKVVEAQPDLVVLAFGMNDSAGRPAADYQANTKKMMDAIRAKRPEAEFILVASMLGNRNWIRLRHELFPEYRDALAQLRQPGVALADLTAIWTEFLALKQDWDQSGNGVNHPNDFGHRVYAQTLAALLVDERPAPAPQPTSTKSRRPNILWILSEDMSPHFGCYGETSIATPNVDRLAAEGTRFARAHVTAPICSTSRSALITGMYQTSIGAHHHRSGRGTVKITLPEGVVPIPQLFKEAGYWTANGAWPVPNRQVIGKTDYNFEWRDLYDGADWSGRAANQPFFAQIQVHGGKVRDGANAANVFQQKLGSLTATDGLPLPPYYPRTPAILEDWARTLDACRLVDQQVGEIRQRLEREGELDNTLIFFLTDHGVSHARGKQYLYAEGTHIPFIVRGPGIASGQVRDDLIEHIDLAATSLALAGIPRPATMQARNVLAADYRPREAIFAARDRADETVDHIRSVRTSDWLYIRNFLPHRPHLQPNNYKDHKACYIALRAAQATGELDAVQNTLFAPTRPAEELYDTRKDRWEIQNLAADPTQATTLAEMRQRLDRWMADTNDRGRQPESDAQFDSDMAVYLSESGKADRGAEIRRNIALMKQWAAEGK